MPKVHNPHLTGCLIDVVENQVGSFKDQLADSKSYALARILIDGMDCHAFELSNSSYHAIFPGKCIFNRVLRDV